MTQNKMSRGKFLSYTAVGAAGVMLPSIVTSCAGGGKSGSEGSSEFVPLQSDTEAYIPDLSNGKAIDGKPIRAGIIGCGSRGSGAAMDFLNSANDVSIVAMADVFPDRLEALRKNLKDQKNMEVADNQIYYGFDAYQKLIDNADIDMVIITTPTVFHPDHMKYAVEKGKHVFCEKPAAVDAVGTRKVLAACKTARANNLSIVTGTQRHHSPDYIESYRKIREGWIGEIVSGNVYWNQGGPWFVKRKPEWSDMEYMLRDFFSWNWLCGDCILDQGVHNVDVFTWFSHLKPVSVVGMGGRQQRTTGDIYDHFSLDIVYENGVHCHAMARQIDDCANSVSETIQGTKGSWSSNDFAIRDLKGNIIWQFDKEKYAAQYPEFNGYVNEHANLVGSIRSGKPICLAETTAYSSAACNMGRESAYTGKEYTLEEFLASDFDLMVSPLTLGNTDMSKHQPKLPGKSNSSYA